MIGRALTLMFAPVVFPLRACRLLWRAIKPLRLWWNAYQYKQSEEQIAFFRSQRECLVAAERAELQKQALLVERRNRINQQ